MANRRPSRRRGEKAALRSSSARPRYSISTFDSLVKLHSVRSIRAFLCDKRHNVTIYVTVSVMFPDTGGGEGLPAVDAQAGAHPA